MEAKTDKGKQKSEATRARILETALELFRKDGFESTTMRGIASASGVALGAAYYYFASKDAIVLAFYQQAQEEMAPMAERAVEATRDLGDRLRALIQVKLDYFGASRRLFSALSAHTDPESALSPFSEGTREIRERDMAFFARALDGSRTRVPADLRTHLPRLLWIYQMGIILFWIHDRSPKQHRTRALLDRSTDLIVKLLKFSGLPLTKPIRRTVIELVDLVVEA